MKEEIVQTPQELVDELDRIQNSDRPGQKYGTDMVTLKMLGLIAQRLQKIEEHLFVIADQGPGK